MEFSVSPFWTAVIYGCGEEANSATTNWMAQYMGSIIVIIKRTCMIFD